MIFNNCRFCNEWRDRNIVRYAVRHFAHPKCFLDRKQLIDLPWHQIERMPYQLLKKRGLVEEAQRLIDAKHQPKTTRQMQMEKIFGQFHSPRPR